MNTVGLFAVFTVLVAICSTLLLEINRKNGISVLSPNFNITFGNPACINCNKTVAASLESFKPFMKTFDYESFTITTLPICKKCSFIGLDSLEMYGDSCAVPLVTNPNITDYQTNYKWNNITYLCEDCGLSTNPITLALTLLRELEKALRSCLNRDISLEVDGVVTGLGDIIKHPSLGKILSLKCVLSAVGQPIAIENMNIKFNWIDLKGTVTVRKDSKLRGYKAITVLKGNVVERNFSNTIASCESAKPTALNACNCVFHSEVFVTIFTEIVDILLACGIRSNNTSFKSALDSYVICSP